MTHQAEQLLAKLKAEIAKERSMVEGMIASLEHEFREANLKEKPEPTEATCEDYGEPLAVKNIPVSEFVRPPHATIGIIVDRHGNEQYSEIQAKRRVDCQNAMAGLSDPAAFVERAKKLIEHIRDRPYGMARNSAESAWFERLAELVRD